MLKTNETKKQLSEIMENLKEGDVIQRAYNVNTGLFADVDDNYVCADDEYIVVLYAHDNNVDYYPVIDNAIRYAVDNNVKVIRPVIIINKASYTSTIEILANSIYNTIVNGATNNDNIYIYYNSETGDVRLDNADGYDAILIDYTVADAYNAKYNSASDDDFFNFDFEETDIERAVEFSVDRAIAVRYNSPLYNNI